MASDTDNRHRSFSEPAQPPTTAAAAAAPTLAIALPGGCRFVVHAAHHAARPFFPLQGAVAHARPRCRCVAPDAAVLAHWLLEWRAWNGTRVLAPEVRRLRAFRRAARRAICDPAVHEFSHLCRDAVDEGPGGRLRYAAVTDPVVPPIWRWIAGGCVGPQPRRVRWGALATTTTTGPADLDADADAAEDGAGSPASLGTGGEAEDRATTENSSREAS